MSGPGLILPPSVVDTTETEIKMMIVAKAQFIGLPVGVINDQTERLAFEKLRNMGCLQLIDLTPLPMGVNGAQVVVRLFALTATGRARLEELQKKSAIDKKLEGK